MGLFTIDEMKYSVESRLSGVTPSTKNLLNKFNEGISVISETLKTKVSAETHIRGLSYFIAPTRAFIFLDIKKNFLSLKFYTGKDEIIGLPEANWIKGEDSCGSITFRIEDDRSLAKALTFARRSCEIALKTLSDLARKKVLISNTPQRTERPISSAPIRPKDLEAMDLQSARQIILHAVSATKWRWKQYDQSWHDIDCVFIQHGYEQGGFHMFKFVPLLEEREIFTIERLGSILSKPPIQTNKYDRDYAGFMEASFYLELKNVKRGSEGSRFYDAVSVFLNNRIGSPGRFFWLLLWQLLVSCHDLRRNHDGSFARYMLTEYSSFCGKGEVFVDDFLSIGTELWEAFLQKRKPWKSLYGVGENTFDFIVGDIVEANFVMHSYKFDSANQHFFHVTGISDLIEPFDRNGTIKFLRRIELPYTLREINKGIYTYCSNTERDNFGYCRSLSKCRDCGVSGLCRQIFQG